MGERRSSHTPSVTLQILTQPSTMAPDNWLTLPAEMGTLWSRHS